MPALFFSHKDLNEVELKIKCLLTKKGARYLQHLNTLLYASRLVGGLGLNELTNIYKTKIKSALRITTSKYPKLQAVAQFQQAEEVKDRRSMLEDTKKCAVDMRMILELANDPRLSFETTEGRIYIASDLNVAKKLLAKRPSDKTNWRSKRASGRGTLCQTDLMMKQLNFQSALIEAINGNRPQPTQSAH